MSTDLRGEKLLRRRRRIWSYTAMAALAVFFLFPLVFMFVSSLKPNAQILADVGSLRSFLPVGDVSLDNYAGVFERVPVASRFPQPPGSTELPAGGADLLARASARPDGRERRRYWLATVVTARPRNRPGSRPPPVTPRGPALVSSCYPRRARLVPPLRCRWRRTIPKR